MFVAHSQAIVQPLSPALERRVLAYAQPLMLVEMTMQQGAVGAMHTHPHCQIDYVVSGAVDFTLGTQTRRMQPGDSVFIPPETPHGAVALENGTVLLDIFAPMRDDFVP